MIPVDVATCVDDLVTRTISDAAGDYPGVHTREGVIGDKMATAEDVMTLMDAELGAEQRRAAQAEAKIAELKRQVERESNARCLYEMMAWVDTLDDDGGFRILSYGIVGHDAHVMAPDATSVYDTVCVPLTPLQSEVYHFLCMAEGTLPRVLAHVRAAAQWFHDFHPDLAVKLDI
jgi:hypothetical protein